MRALGWQTAVVSYVDLKASEASALALALNRTAETAEWDTERLQAVIDACLADDVPLDDLGFDDASIKAMMADPAAAMPEAEGADDGAEADTPQLTDTPPVEVLPPGPEPDDDKPVPEGKPSRFKRGDVYLLDSPAGQHRVMCGSSADFGDVERLMAGAKADMVFTDPPYNIGGQNKVMAASVRKNYAGLKGADWDQQFDFDDVSHNMLAVLADDASVYVCTSHHLFGDIVAWMKTWSDHNNFCVWAKTNPMPSLQKRHWTWSCELLCYGTRGKHTFNFPDVGHALNVWSLQKNPSNTLHPTQKPVAVPRHAIAHSSAEGALVVDFFGGSGCTIMACGELGRVCYTMEVSETYCETLTGRYERTYGVEAVREER
jgi:DNA modification methylase